MIARRIKVRGRVQGVGFRYAMAGAAEACGIAGWVRNRNDGTVEAFVQGAPEAVARYLEWARHGPPLARVATVDVVDAEPDESLRDFAWRPTE